MIRYAEMKGRPYMKIKSICLLCAAAMLLLCSCAKTDSFITVSEDMSTITYRNEKYKQLYDLSIKVNDLELVSDNPTIEGHGRFSKDDGTWMHIYTVEGDADGLFLHAYTENMASSLYCRSDKAEEVQNDITNADFDSYKFEGRDVSGKSYSTDISQTLGEMFKELISDHDGYVNYDTIKKDTSVPYIYLYAFSGGEFFNIYMGFIFAAEDGSMYILSSYTEDTDESFIPFRAYLIDPIYYSEIEHIIAREE